MFLSGLVKRKTVVTAVSVSCVWSLLESCNNRELLHARYSFRTISSGVVIIRAKVVWGCSGVMKRHVSCTIFRSMAWLFHIVGLLILTRDSRSRTAGKVTGCGELPHLRDSFRCAKCSVISYSKQREREVYFN